MAVRDHVDLTSWLETPEGTDASDADEREVPLPVIAKSGTLQLTLGKLYASPEPTTSGGALHTWTSSGRGPEKTQAEFATEVYRQSGAGKFKYCLRFIARKGSILSIQTVKVTVKKRS